jgi:hypothetical protein
MKFPEKYRKPRAPAGYSSKEGDPFGIFIVPHGADRLFIIATDGMDPNQPEDAIKWNHVSVSVTNRRGVRLGRCATWEQMCHVKDLFWEPEETVLQFHPKKSEYVNCHPHCLHLWLPVGIEVQLPPAIFVGPKSLVDLTP